MKPDGSEQTQVTNDEFNNWFPHIAPDGKSMVVLSYGQDVAPAITRSTSTSTCAHMPTRRRATRR